ncbi:MAG: YggT family protein [Steroidobacteraceae bacterium]
MAALIFIVRTLLSLLVTVFLLRFLLPVCRADARNPLSQAVIKLTNPLVLPLRRVLPPIKRVDTASLVALLLVQLAATALIWLLSGYGLSAPVALLYEAVRELLSLVLRFYFFIILIYALLSWVAPGTYSPAASVLNSLCTPILRPFQRLIPPIVGIDLSALFALIAIQALQILLSL